MDLLELRNLKKYFATQKAVDDISLTIKEGSIFGMLGLKLSVARVARDPGADSTEQRDSAF